MVQFSHPYMTGGKTIVLTRRTFVGKVMSLLFMLCRWVITLWQIDGETVRDFIVLAPKSLWMVTVAMKLKNAYSLEGKL